MKITKTNRMRLHELEAAEISLVKQGANRRRFMIFKSAGGAMPQNTELHNLISKTDPAIMQKVAEHLSKWGSPTKKEGMPPPAEPAHDPATEGAAGLDDQSTAAVKAIVRILTPFKGKISPVLLHEILELAGFELTNKTNAMPQPKEVAGATHQGDGTQTEGLMAEPKMELKEGLWAIPEKIEDEENDFLEGVEKGHMEEAAKVAKAAYKECLQKLGYQKYPEAQIAMKRKGTETEGVKGEPVTKSANAPDLSQVDPKTRETVELVLKSNKDLIQKTADLEAMLKKRDDEAREKELVVKAAEWKHLALPQENLVAQLKAADKAGKETFELVTKNFDALNEQAKTGNLFGEIGSNLPNPNMSSSDSIWQQIEKEAEKVVRKGDEKVRPADAVETYLKTPNGQKLYADYKKARGGI